MIAIGKYHNNAGSGNNKGILIKTSPGSLCEPPSPAKERDKILTQVTDGAPLLFDDFPSEGKSVRAQ